MEQQQLNLTKDFIYLKSFATKLSLTVKIKDRRVDKSDFVSILQEKPKAYKNATWLYQNIKEDQILPIIVTTIMQDIKEINNKNKTFLETYDFISSGQLKEISEHQIKELDDLIPGIETIDNKMKTGIYVSNIVNYIFNLLEKNNDNELSETFYIDSLFQDILIESNSSGYNIEKQKYSDNIMDKLDNILTESIFNITNIISKKSLKPELQYVFPSSHSLATFMTLLGMVYCKFLV